MKECKDEAILPCYRDGYGVWHHLDDTHDKVYELNKQMCDIGKTMNDTMKPLSEETAQETIKTLEDFSKSLEAEIKALELINLICEDIEKSIKSDDMEKKTKKMTKVEAFEYLKGKRVVCDNFNCVAIQCKFFEVGIKWRGGSTEATEDRGSFLFVDLNGYLTHCNSRVWFDRHEYEEISADDILSIEIVDEKKGDERKGEILDEIAKLGENISDLIEEYEGDIVIEINQYEVLLRNSGDILYRK